MLGISVSARLEEQNCCHGHPGLRGTTHGPSGQHGSVFCLNGKVSQPGRKWGLLLMEVMMVGMACAGNAGVLGCGDGGVQAYEDAGNAGK